MTNTKKIILGLLIVLLCVMLVATISLTCISHAEATSEDASSTAEEDVSIRSLANNFWFWSIMLFVIIVLMIIAILLALKIKK